MKNRFSFRKSGVFWGVTLILSAVLIILDSIGIGLGFLSGVPVISIVLGIICLAWLIDELIKLKISHIFFPLAFGGLMPASELAKMMLIQVSAKTLYEIIVLPLTTQIVKYIKRREGTSVYDENISYNVFKVNEI